MIINAAKYSCAAGHGINEDSCLCSAEKGIFIVADGLGGHSSGEKASFAAVDYFERNCTGGYTENRITELMEGANTEVTEKGDGGKTTVAAAFTENGNFIYANAGDSRVYYFREGRIIAQTKDHSVCQASADMGMIRQEDIRGSEDRSRLLKVLGGDERLNIKKHYAPIKIQDGDAFLLCSDGFWDYVYETEMEADLLKSDDPEAWLKHMLKRHILRAENKGDNYTAICGIIHLDGSETYVPPTAEIKASEVKTPEASVNSTKNNRRLIAIAAVGVLLIAAAIALAVLLQNNDGSGVISEATETSPVPETTAEITETTAEITETAAEISETSAEEAETSSEAVSDTDISGSESKDETVSETTEAASETGAEEAETGSEVVSDTDLSEPETEDETVPETTEADSETGAEEAETVPEAVSDTDISEPGSENGTISEASENKPENITEEKTADGIENDLP